MYAGLEKGEKYRLRSFDYPRYDLKHIYKRQQLKFYLPLNQPQYQRLNALMLKLNMLSYFSQLALSEQLKIIHNTDILIGVHEAASAYALFLPDWAGVFEMCVCRSALLFEMQL